MSPTPDAPTPVGQQLAERRDELDLTQETLARRIGITSATVSATERGKTEISRTKRPSWEQALNLKPGTIARAYRDGTRIEPAPATDPAPYANLADSHERAIWEMNISEDDRRTLIDILRSDRSGQRRPA
jgi:transcriptional regulator with XRE-family HTH domain